MLKQVLYALNITRYVWIAVDYISAAGTYYRYAAPEAGVLAFEDCHTSCSLVGQENFHPYMEAYRTCLCHTYRPWSIALESTGQIERTAPIWEMVRFWNKWADFPYMFKFRIPCLCFWHILLLFENHSLSIGTVHYILWGCH